MQLPDIKRVKAKGKWYYYFRTGQRTAAGKEILTRLPDPKAPNFGDTYAALRGAKTKRATPSDVLTVTGFIRLYEKSHHFRSRSAGTQRLYGIYLRQLQSDLPTAPADMVERKDIAALIDKRAETPGAANSLLRTVNALWQWGRKRGHVTNDPGRDVGELDTGEHEPWPQNVLNAALASDDERVRLVTHLLYFTALRIGDVLTLRWSDLRGGVIHVTPQKTRRTRGEMQIPVHKELAAELARTPRRGITIVASETGRPYHQHTVREAMKAFAAELGAKVVPHGLRKNAVNALLEAGCSVAETSAISGQSLGMVEHYAKARAQGSMASAAILKWERNR